MIIYHGKAAFEPNVRRNGSAFVATASIFEEDGQQRSLGELGIFASEQCAMLFAVKAATAFIEGEDLPVPPVRLSAQAARH
jgi:hypothetical protein